MPKAWYSGPTGKVLAEKLPVGAFCPRKLASTKSATRNQRKKQAGHLTLLPWWHGNQDFIRDCFSDEWATEHHATAFSIKKHDDFLIETHGNCRKYAILHASQSLDQKIGGYFDRRTISSGLKRSLHSAGHRIWQIRQPPPQSKLRELRQWAPARYACFVPVMQKMQNNWDFTLSQK